MNESVLAILVRTKRENQPRVRSGRGRGPKFRENLGEKVVLRDRSLSLRPIPYIVHIPTVQAYDNSSSYTILRLYVILFFTFFFFFFRLFTIVSCR